MSTSELAPTAAASAFRSVLPYIPRIGSSAPRQLIRRKIRRLRIERGYGGWRLVAAVAELLVVFARRGRTACMPRAPHLTAQPLILLMESGKVWVRPRRRRRSKDICSSRQRRLPPVDGPYDAAAYGLLDDHLFFFLDYFRFLKCLLQNLGLQIAQVLLPLLNQGLSQRVNRLYRGDGHRIFLCPKNYLMN